MNVIKSVMRQAHFNYLAQRLIDNSRCTINTCKKLEAEGKRFQIAVDVFGRTIVLR